MLDRQTCFMVAVAISLCVMAYVSVMIGHSSVAALITAALVIALLVMKNVKKVERPSQKKQLNLPLVSE